LRKSNLKASSGFSLIEVLIAMLILSGGILVVANSWSGNYNRLQKSRINNTMAHLLQKKMTELELEYKDKPIDEVKEEDGGEFEEYKGFTWKMKSQEFEMPDLSSALIAQNEGTDDMTLMIVKQVTEYIRKTVKEVTLTVSYRAPRAKNVIRQEVTTYFVDFKKEVPLSPGGGGG
jgi:general secretion pathway protein I